MSTAQPKRETVTGDESVDREDDSQEENQLELEREGSKSKIPVWDYFTKTDKNGDARAQCNFCHKLYNYSTTVANLKSHLARQHIDAFPDCEELHRRRQGTTTRPRGPRTVSEVWNFFDKLEDYMAACTLCSKELSYRSTVHNLRLHLNRIHPGSLNAEQEAETSYEDVQYLDMCNGEDSESSEQTVAQAEERIWRYFQREGEGLARCGLCETLLSARRMRRHLEERHASLVGVLTQASDDEDEKPLAQTRKDPLKSTVIYAKKREHDQNPESAKDDCPPKRRKVGSLDSFLQYIGNLLEDTPRDLNLQLQMEIVNLIMKARLGLERNPGVPNSTQKVHGSHGVRRSDKAEAECSSGSERVKYQVVFPRSVEEGMVTVESLVAEAVGRGLTDLNGTVSGVDISS